SSARSRPCSTPKSSDAVSASGRMRTCSFGKQAVHRFNQLQWQSLHMHAVSLAVDATQVQIGHATDMPLVVVVGKTRAKLPMECQRVKRVLQVVAFAQDGIAHGAWRIGAGIITQAI